jgi:hypothetical protein
MEAKFLKRPLIYQHLAPMKLGYDLYATHGNIFGGIILDGS